ncbi:MAG TPA: hypothetical protein VE397_18265 [Stellaceae bacterium]|nr:hypothetical protein [Stellaceae bacterium]
MRRIVFSLVAVAALSASIGIAKAEGPVKLADGQLDNVTAGSIYAAAMNYAGAVNTAVGANLTAMASPNAVGNAVDADLATASAFNSLLAACITP